MKGLLFATVAAIVLLVAASAHAHHGGARVVFVPDGFGGARAVVVNDPVIVSRGFHGPVVVRGNRRNRFGFRR